MSIRNIVQSSFGESDIACVCGTNLSFQKYLNGSVLYSCGGDVCPYLQQVTLLEWKDLIRRCKSLEPLSKVVIDEMRDIIKFLEENPELYKQSVWIQLESGNDLCGSYRCFLGDKLIRDSQSNLAVNNFAPFEDIQTYIQSVWGMTFVEVEWIADPNNTLKSLKDIVNVFSKGLRFV